MTCKTRKNTIIAIMAITAMLLLVPTTIVTVTAYAEQQQQQQQQNADKQLQETHANDNNNHTNTTGSVGNTGTDDANPEYNETKAEKDPALTQKEINIRVNELIDEIGMLEIENWHMYDAVSDEGLLDEHTLDKIAQNNRTIHTLEDEVNRLDPIPPDIHIPEDDLKRLKDAESAVFESNLPWFLMYINRATATLDIMVDIRYAEPDTEEKITKLTKDASVVITYAKNNIRL